MQDHCYVGPKRTEASTSTTAEGQEELVATSTDGSSDSSDEDYDDASYDEDEDETTTTTTGTLESSDRSSRDDDTVAENRKEQSQYSGSVVDDLPRDEPVTLDQLTEHVDSLSHHLDEPLPPPNNNTNNDQLLDYFENPDLHTEQSLVSVVDITTTVVAAAATTTNSTTADTPTTITATTSIVENKIVSPVYDLETEQSLLSIVDNNITCVVNDKITPPVTDIDNENITDETSNLISSIDDKVIEEILAKEALLEHRGDEFTVNEMNISEETGNDDLQNDGFVHIETSEIPAEIEKNNNSEFSGFIEDHYSKEVRFCNSILSYTFC